MTGADACDPTWDDTIAALFAEPFWLPEDRRASVGDEWRSCMKPLLSSYENVRGSAVTIYEHLASREMPLVTDPAQFWPAEALALLRRWIEQGCRRSAEDPIVHDGPILPVSPPSPPLRVRRNILDLGQDELGAYRERLEQLGATSLDKDAQWQQIGSLHSDWCLHYQEAFLSWHRANLLWFEDLVGMPIPYWNFMSPQAATDGAPQAGLVAPFRELTYIVPSTGRERPNPLRFAVAFGGRSKACQGADTPPDVDCHYVQRFPWLYTSGDDDRHKREQWLAMLATFQQQIDYALGWSVFSTPEGAPGMPWADIPTFHPPQPDRLYPHRTDFDGLYEQPHDNLHGWIGPDMADNNYTAFDPVFWSLHSGIDRIFEQWLRAHPASQFTSNFPLRPFVGPRAAEIDLTNPDAFVYTTLGDMARDSRALGYDYGPTGEDEAAGRPLRPAVSARADDGEHLYVLFPDTRCILETYTIDVFVNLSDPAPEHMRDGDADHFAGRITRLGMGVEDDKGRCVATGVTRVLDATHTARHLGLTPDSDVTVGLVVTHLHSGRALAPEEYRELPGFEPVVRWGSAMPATDPPGGNGRPCDRTPTRGAGGAAGAL
ncbi:MAG TPA: tyrosinase family protein [Solirubrobacteraceae bacterium]|nr:tyrosinase family protein [Solirubrobacteraceae bacterium]